ncbi:MAG TPA: glycosyltransferase [Vicinamibacterales bacterium]|nr:glycosyltransferase [Vicinamibacterales bacterium]
MRVAIFTDNDFDRVNGVTTTLKAVLRHAPEDIHARVFGAADLDIDAPDYRAVASVGVEFPWYREMRVYWPRWRALSRALRAEHADLVHVTTTGPTGLAACRLAQGLGLPVVGSVHARLGDYFRALNGLAPMARRIDQCARWCYRDCDSVLVPSEGTRTTMIDEGYASEQLRVWSPGVDADRFSPARRSNALRERWHVSDRRLAILYCGRLVREKGLDVIEPLYRWLLRRGIAHRFVFVGAGPLRAALAERCPDAMFLGEVPHADVGVAMASADVFLFPSATDASGTAVLEAQASGLPVLVTDRGGPLENMQPGVTGRVCGDGDVDAFGQGLADLARRPALRQSMAAAARAYAVERPWSRALAPLHAAWRTAVASSARIASRRRPQQLQEHVAVLGHPGELPRARSGRR